MLEARDIIASKLGKDNPQYAEILKNVAVFYISEKKFEIAFNALTAAEGIWQAKTGTRITSMQQHLYAYRRCVLPTEKLQQSRRVLQ